MVGLKSAYLHPTNSAALSRPLSTPAASTPPKPFATVLPQYITATQGAISLGLYHELMSSLLKSDVYRLKEENTAYSAPAKNGDSANPRKNRTIRIPTKLCVAAVQGEIPPQMSITVGRYRDGLTRVRMMLLGICPKR
jgi:hypothetical protein